MADKGIIFSAPMVRALLDGRKTQTRRLFKPRGFRFYTHPVSGDRYDEFRTDKYGNMKEEGISGSGPMRAFAYGDGLYSYLAYAPGDRLYVRESGIEYPGLAGGSDLFRHDVPAEVESGYYWVRDRLGTGASYNVQGCSRDAALAGGNRKVRPSIHMPRWASRLWLAVTDVRVQRLQDCSEADAIAESIYEVRSRAGDGMRHFGTKHEDSVWPTATRAYRALWDSLHTAEGTTWEANPWVVAVSFAVHQGNIDAEAAHG